MTRIHRERGENGVDGLEVDPGKDRLLEFKAQGMIHPWGEDRR
jgi:hypothetical protein